jgi:hypothetical protein
MLHDPDVWRAVAEERVQGLIRDATSSRRGNSRQPSPRGRVAVLLRGAADRLDRGEPPTHPNLVSGG